MLNIEFELDEDHYRETVERAMRDGVRPALADAVNAVADLVRRRLERATREVFDSPVPYTQHAFGMFSARPDDVDPAAAVFVFPRQALYLALEVFGGVRQAGDYATLPTGVLVPGADASLDGYGNLPRDLLAQAAADPKDSWIRLGPEGTETLIRHEQGGRIDILAEVLPETHYDERFDFFGIAGREVLDTLPAAVAEVLSAQ